jgi:hypothetical protein
VLRGVSVLTVDGNHGVEPAAGPPRGFLSVMVLTPLFAALRVYRANVAANDGAGIDFYEITVAFSEFAATVTVLIGVATTTKPACVLPVMLHVTPAWFDSHKTTKASGNTLLPRLTFVLTATPAPPPAALPIGIHEMDVRTFENVRRQTARLF